MGGIGKYVMAIGEFYELYDVWWGWCWRGGGGVSMGPPSTHKTSFMSLGKHVHWDGACASE